MSSASDDARSYDIASLASEEQVSLRTLRFYEEKGLIAPTRVGSRRVYSATDRIKLQLILKGRRLGFTLEQVRNLILDSAGSHQSNPTAAALLPPDTILAQIAALERKRDGLHEAIATLQTALGGTDPEAAQAEP